MESEVPWGVEILHGDFLASVAFGGVQVATVRIGQGLAHDLPEPEEDNPSYSRPKWARRCAAPR
jgi:hypothetical protein